MPDRRDDTNPGCHADPTEKMSKHITMQPCARPSYRATNAQVGMPEPRDDAKHHR